MVELVKHIISRESLKACDIRGVYGKSLFEEDFYYIGRAFGTILQERGLYTCSVGRDGRVSSNSLTQELIKGLVDSNITVYNLGVVSSPALYYSFSHLNLDGGCMVTASHNPAKYNGCKFVLKDTIFGEENIKEIDKICKHARYVETKGTGSVTKYSINNLYLDHLLKVVNTFNLKNSKIIWDGSNGSSLFILKDLIAKLPGKHILICDEIDGTFPNHLPDPSKEENLVMLKEAVLQNKADIGIVFDGDGDRLGCITGEGKYVTGDQILTILALDYLSQHPGAKVMSEVKVSKIFSSEVEKAKGVPIIHKVGHTYQQERLFDEQIGFAGETSGHIFYLENNGEDDGIYAALKLLNIVYANKKCSINEIWNSLPKIYSKGEIRLTLSLDDRSIIIKKLKELLNADNRQFNNLDGYRVECEDGFWLARASNTQPQITVYVEASNEENYENNLKELKHYISQCGFNYDELALVKDE